MAEIFPFKALRYSPTTVALGSVVTQPYDKITPEMQERYYHASPYNLVRIILGKRHPGDDEAENVYTRAAGFLAEWRKLNVMQLDDQPSIYSYSQTFRLPETPGSMPHAGGSVADRTLQRGGFIATCRLHDYSEGIIYRHEQTLSKPKSDRLNLLRATRTHFGQIFMLYSDAQRQIEKLLKPTAPADIEVTDEYGVVHRVCKVSDAGVIASVAKLMADKKLIIADGHHRYETALNYRNERRAEAGKIDPSASFERVMMTFINIDDPGLTVLPTHRVVFGLPGFSFDDFLQKARPYFDVEHLGNDLQAELATSRLANAGAGDRIVFVAAASQGRGMVLLREKPGASDVLLSGLSERQRRLDVVQLHKVLLEGVLGISEEAIRDQSHVRYARYAEEALAAVREGANLTFLINPVSIHAMQEVAFAGEVMPQKSTDFYPKLLSGLTMYPVNESSIDNHD